MLAAPDYYQLLRNPREEISSAVWEEVVRSVVEYRQIQNASDQASDCLKDILFECSQEWIDRRVRIIRGAENDSSDPSCRSEYCLRSLRNLVSETSKEAARYEESPELSQVDRQVSDHLRKLDHEGILESYRLRSRKGKDICNLWALASWGEDWRDMQPKTDLDQVRKDLPIILAHQGGKGLFDYADVLPSFILMILEAYGAALSAAQIKSVIVSLISRPLFRNPKRISVDNGQGSSVDGYFPGSHRPPPPDELMAEEELKQNFMNSLTEREKAILDLKKEGFSIEQIAERLGCSPRTINNEWNNILEKYQAVLAA